MAYGFNERLIEEIRDKNDVVDIVSEVVRLKRAGSNYNGLCPFHNEKTPSFTVSPAKQIYHCFGCGNGGDVIKFVMEYRHMTFVEALEYLAERAGIEIKGRFENKDSSSKEKKAKVYDMNVEAARFFYKNLSRNKRAQSYLSKRGIDLKVVKAYGLGFSEESWDSLKKYLNQKGYSDKEIFEAGLLSQRKDKSGYYDKFRNRVMFPIIDTRGRVIAFGGRVMDDSMPKYMNSPDTPIFNKGYNLYSLNIAQKHIKESEIVLVEGYMDVISLYKFGIKTAIASLGTALTEFQAKLINRYTNKVFISYDSDAAGIKAADKAIDILKTAGVEARVIILKDAKDPDEYISRYGKSAFEKLKESALGYIDFKIYLLKKEFDISKVEEKIKFVKGISKELKKIKSPIERDAYIKRIASETKINIQAINKELGIVQKSFNNNNFKRKSQPEKPIIQPIKVMLEAGHLKAEKELISLVLKGKNLYLYVKDKFSSERFLDEDIKIMAEKIYISYDQYGELNQEYIKESLSEETFKKFEELYNKEILIDESNRFKAVDDYIKTIETYKMRQRLMEIKNKQDKSSDDYVEIMELNKRLKSLK